MISSTNVGFKNLVKKDYKKNKIELITNYTPLGIEEDFLDPKDNSNSKFSIAGKARHI